MKTLLFLERRLASNAIWSVLTNAKRLIPVAILFTAFAVTLAQSIAFSIYPDRLGAPQLTMLRDMPIDTIEAWLSMILVGGCVLVLYNSFNSGLLIFSPSQIDFLFPLPIPRRTVLLFKLAKDYLKYAAYIFGIGVMIAPIIIQALSVLGVSFMPYGWVSIAALVGLILAVINTAHVINLIFSSSYQKLAQAGVLIKTVLLGVLLVTVIIAVFAFLSTGDLGTGVTYANSFPLFKWLFVPARWCASLMLAPLIGITDENWIRLGLIWFTTIVMFAVLVSRRENIYEPALQPSAAYYARRMAAMTGDRESIRVDDLRNKQMKRAGLTLPPFGTGWSAMLWKNLQVRVRVRGWRMLLELAAPWLLAYAVGATQQNPELIKYTPLFIPYMAGMLAMTIQPEVRSEIKHASITKCMPITPWKVAMAHILESLAYVILFALFVSLAAVMMLPGIDRQLLAACALFTPFFAFALIPPLYIAALFYPNARDFVQNFLSVIVGLLFAAIAVTPTFALLLFNYVSLHLDMWPITLLLCSVDLVIGLGGAIIAGAVYDAFDPGAE